MPNRLRQWYSEPLSFESRLTGFHPWVPGTYPGVYSWERCEDERHARLGNGWSGGGPLKITRETHAYTPDPLYVTAGNFRGHVRIANTISGTDITPYAVPSALQLAADGTTAIARTEPTNPAFDLSVFLGELRAEGIPNLPGHTLRDKTNIARSSGGEYLNLEFGWNPLVRGVRDFAHTVANSDKILNTYSKYSNRVLGRSYEWPTLTESNAYASTLTEEHGAGFFTGGGRVQRKLQKKWFEVDYVYYLPVGNSTRENIARYGSYARKLLGIDLSPEVLWNLSPWSWAADWFGNVGDVMHNVSALGQDGLVIRNGYIMCHTRFEQFDHGRFDGGPSQTHLRVSEVKLRQPATPFGFGVSYSGLSQKQIAIISALGLSRW
jgi:hypothetical protein